MLGLYNIEGILIYQHRVQCFYPGVTLDLSSRWEKHPEAGNTKTLLGGLIVREVLVLAVGSIDIIGLS